MIANIQTKVTLLECLKNYNIDEIDVFSLFTKIDRSDIIDSLMNDKFLYSPYRSETVPSFKFYLGRNNSIRAKDFGGNFSGDCLEAASTILGLQLKGQEFVNLLNKVYEYSVKKLGIDLNKSEVILKTKDKVTVDVDIRNWENRDFTYWITNYEFELDELDYFGIYPIQKVYLNGKEYKGGERNLVYGYVVTPLNEQPFWKVYFPDQTPKFIAGGIGLDFLPYVNLEDKELNIIKSRKDAMSIYYVNSQCVVTNSESSTRLTKDEIDLFKDKSGYFLAEDDAAGKKGFEIIKKQGLNINLIPFFSTGLIKAAPHINDFAELRGYLRKDLFKEFLEYYFSEKPSQPEMVTFIEKLLK